MHAHLRSVCRNVYFDQFLVADLLELILSEREALEFDQCREEIRGLGEVVIAQCEYLRYVCMYAFVYVYVYICICACTHLYMCMYTFVYVC
jgi:hypothetical protein